VPRRSPQAKTAEAKQTSPAALIGFGAVLALASAATPWYLLGAPTSPKAVGATISDLLALGWQWFPGLPLSLIAVGTVMSTFLALLAGRNRAHPMACVAVGLFVLLNATWLGLGFGGPPPAAPVEAVPPSTGASLAIIGAIVIVASGIWLIRQSGGSGPQQRRPS